MIDHVFEPLKNLTSKIGSGSTPRGGQSSYKQSGISLIRSQNVLDMAFSKDGLVYIDEDQASKLNNVEVLKNDILLNITGDSIARVCKVPEGVLPARVNQHVSILRTNGKVDPDYLLYYLIYRKSYLLTIGRVGGTRNALTKEAIEKLEIRIDNKQQQIASVLSALDNKIELNNRINAELEQMAKTLYDYWFVQFDFPNEVGKPYKSSGGKTVYNKVLKREIPEGWEVQVFSDWIKETKAGDWGKDIEEGNYTERVYCVRGADINGLNGKGEVKAPQRFILKNNLSKALKSNDFIIEISGGSPTQSTGRIALLTNKTFERFDTGVICSNFCKAISLKDEKYIFNFQQEWQRLYNAGVFFGYEGKTSGIKNFLFDSFVNSCKVVLPPKDIVEQYYNIAQTLDEKKQSNLQQNQELAQLRNWLLPMLMNGQLKVVDHTDNDKADYAIPTKQMDSAAEPTIGYQERESLSTEGTAKIDPQFEFWLSNQGLAARGDIDTATLREIFEAMDDEDK
jgi:type I restriction enzyme S subunit